ncbi:MAG: porin family protein [bacterium]|nr:porin family protein [bacterium]
MKTKLLLIIAIPALLLIPGTSLSAKSKSVYIHSFAVDATIDKTDSIGDDIQDYMSEVFIEDEEYILTSEEDVKREVRNLATMQVFDADNPAAFAKELMKIIETDYIVLGKVFKKKGVIVITAKMMEAKGGIIKVSSSSVIRVRKPRYLWHGSRALASYLASNKEKYINRFYSYVTDKEDGLKERKIDHQDDLKSIQEAAVSKREKLRSSPLIRFGFGSFAIKGFDLVDMYNPELRDYYTNGTAWFLDYFIYRSKDSVGDGVDLYIRGTYKTFDVDSAGLSQITSDMGADTTNYDGTLGKYYPVPDVNPSLWQMSFDFGMRYVGCTYFLREAWSIYLSITGRYLYLKESYSSGGVEKTKSFNGWAIMAGLGFEVSIIANAGIFAEVNMGYTRIGDSNVNVEGLQILFGATFRTDHTLGSVLGLHIKRDK